MDIFQSLVIGVVQGLTEFIPVSSTAHVRVIPALAGWPDPGAAFSAVIQLGTLVAVLLYFRREIVLLVVSGVAFALRFNRRETLDPDTRRHGRMAWYIVVGSIPIGIVGLVFKDKIETDARSLYLIGATLMALAVVLAFAERVSSRTRKMEEIGFADSQVIGWAQVLSLVPGVSRSGVTITAGLFRGLNRETAARFSFLLSIPALLASGLFELRKVASDGIGDTSTVNVALATVVAFVVGYASIAFLLRFLQTRSTWVFIVYRIVFGAIIVGLTAAAVIS